MRIHGPLGGKEKGWIFDADAKNPSRNNEWSGDVGLMMLRERFFDWDWSWREYEGKQSSPTIAKFGSAEQIRNKIPQGNIDGMMRKVEWRWRMQNVLKVVRGIENVLVHFTQAKLEKNWLLF
jgi:hypothetical protein